MRNITHLQGRRKPSPGQKSRVSLKAEIAGAIVGLFRNSAMQCGRSISLNAS